MRLNRGLPITMDYEKFSSDLSLEDCMVFNSAEENEEVMLSLGVNQQVRQLGKGKFQAHLATRTTEQAELFVDRYSTALSIYLEPPENMVGLLLPRSASGQFLASGKSVANNKLLFMPMGSGTDIVGPDLVGSEAIGIPQARFIELCETLCPTSCLPQDLTAITGNTAQLHSFQQCVLSLVRNPEIDPGPEQLDNLIAEVIAWMGHSLNQCKHENISFNRSRIRVAKQAQEFIESNYYKAIKVEDICREIGIGVRTLQRCFREYFDLTISDYLKSVRLNSAHRELLALHISESTVSDVVMRNGFTHLGRFSVEFRERFGESPNHVLAR